MSSKPRFRLSSKNSYLTFYDTNPIQNYLDFYSKFLARVRYKKCTIYINPSYVCVCQNKERIHVLLQFYVKVQVTNHNFFDAKINGTIIKTYITDTAKNNETTKAYMVDFPYVESGKFESNSHAYTSIKKFFKPYEVKKLKETNTTEIHSESFDLIPKDEDENLPNDIPLKEIQKVFSDKRIDSFYPKKKKKFI